MARKKPFRPRAGAARKSGNAAVSVKNQFIANMSHALGRGTTAIAILLEARRVKQPSAATGDWTDAA